MNIKKLLLIFNLFFVAAAQAFPQAAFSGEDQRSAFGRAMDLFNKEKYAPAIRLFDSYIRDNTDNNSTRASEAEYYVSPLGVLRLYNPDAEYRMLVYMARHPESPRLNEGRVSLADYFYQNKSYRKASAYYETVNRYELSEEKQAEYYFRYGYSLYVKGDKAKALTMFSEIKDKDTEYTAPAIYYFSHISL